MKIRYSNAEWWVILFALFVWFIGPGKLEGRFFPVVAPMEIMSIHDAGGAIVFHGKSNHLRPSCSYRRLEWYFGRREDRSAPFYVNVGRGIVLPDGPFTFGPWYTDLMTKDAFINETFADIFHQCKLFGFDLPWQTKTEFWN